LIRKRHASEVALADPNGIACLDDDLLGIAQVV
jgi:hypothetical protein